MAERSRLIEGWLEGDVLPPEVAAVVLPLMSVEQIVEIEAAFPNTVSIARLNEILAAHDAQGLPDWVPSPEIDRLRQLRNLLVAQVAGAGSHLGLDVSIAALAQLHGVSYVEVEAALLVADTDRLSGSIDALGAYGPTVEALRAERLELLGRLADGDAVMAATIGGLIDDGHGLADAVVLTMRAEAWAMTPDEVLVFDGFVEHFEVFDNATGGGTDEGVSMADLRWVVDHPADFAPDAVAAAAEVLANPTLRYRLDTALENNDVLDADGRFGGTRSDDGFFALADLEMFAMKQNLSFLVAGHFDAVADEGGETDGFLSKHDFETYLELHRAELSAEEIQAFEIVIEAEFYDKGWFEANKHALALAAAVLAGGAFVLMTGGLGSGISGALITTVAAGGVGATAAAGTTFTINAFSDESNWEDDLLANSVDGFFAGAGSGGAVLGVTNVAAMGTAGQIATGLGLTSDMTGLAGLGAFDLGLQYAIHPEEMDEAHDLLNRISLVTGVPAITIGGYAVWANRFAAPDPAVLYRVQGGTPPLASQSRIGIGPSGEMTIEGSNMLFVTFDDLGRARAYVAANRPGAEIISFDVDAAFVADVRASAVPEFEARMSPGVPLIADPSKTNSSFGLRADWIDRLAEAALEGTGRIVE